MNENNINNVTVRKRKNIKSKNLPETNNYTHGSIADTNLNCNINPPKENNNESILSSSSTVTLKHSTLSKIKKTSRKSINFITPNKKRPDSALSFNCENNSFTDNKKRKVIMRCQTPNKKTTPLKNNSPIRKRRTSIVSLNSSLYRTPSKKTTSLKKRISNISTSVKNENKRKSTMSINSERVLKTDNKRKRLSSLFQTPSKRKTPFKKDIDKILTPIKKRSNSIMSINSENNYPAQNKKKRLSSLFQTSSKKKTPYKKRVSEISTPIVIPKSKENINHLCYGSYISKVNTDYVANTNTCVIHETERCGHLKLEFHALIDGQGVPLFAKSVAQRLLKVILLSDYIQQLYETKSSEDSEKIKKVISDSLIIVNAEFKKKSEGICSLSCILVTQKTFYLASIGSTSMFLWQVNKNAAVLEREFFKNPKCEDISTNSCLAKTGKVLCNDISIFEALESSEHSCCCPTVSSIRRDEASSCNKTFILITTLCAVNPKLTIEDLHKILRSSIETKRGLDTACESICKMSQDIQDAKANNETAKVAAMALHFDHEENPEEKAPELRAETASDAAANNKVCKELILCLGSLQKVEHLSTFYD